LTAITRQLLASWSTDTVRVAELRASWCNGLAGSVLLWAKAFEVTGDEAFLAASRAAGNAALAAPAVGPDLCCGLGGMAYALLTLEHVDPERGWRQHADRVAAQAIATALLKWPNGLLRGHPGLVCLATDLMTDRPRGFPAIEA